MDVSFQTAFGYSPPPMVSRSACPLTCQDPCVCVRCNALCLPFAQQHRLDVRAHQLQSSITGPLDQAQITEFKSISSLWSQGMEHATQRCRKLKMEAVNFNPDMNTLRSRVLAWNLQVSKLQGCQAGSRHLQRSIVAADLLADRFALSLPAAILAQKANEKACRIAKKDHVSSRISWMRSVSKAPRDKDGKKNKKTWTPILNYATEIHPPSTVGRGRQRLWQLHVVVQHDGGV